MEGVSLLRTEAPSRRMTSLPAGPMCKAVSHLLRGEPLSPQTGPPKGRLGPKKSVSARATQGGSKSHAGWRRGASRADESDYTEGEMAILRGRGLLSSSPRGGRPGQSPRTPTSQLGGTEVTG